MKCLLLFASNQLWFHFSDVMKHNCPRGVASPAIRELELLVQLLCSLAFCTLSLATAFCHLSEHPLVEAAVDEIEGNEEQAKELLRMLDCSTHELANVDEMWKEPFVDNELMDEFEALITEICSAALVKWGSADFL